MTYGIISLIPVLTVCIVAVATKRVMEPLLAGTIIGFIILAKQNFALAWLGGLYTVLSDSSLQFVIIVPVLFGIFTILLQNSGSTHQFTVFARKYVKSQKGSLLMTWALGLVVFIDDYLNTLVVGPAMRNLTDEYGVPREALGYVLKGTSSPLAVITPFSTWAMFLAGLLIANGVAPEGTDPSALYIKVIPYVFYGFVALILVPLLIVGVIPKIGAMKTAFNRVAETGNTFPSDEVRPESMIDAEDSGKARLYDFFVPIFALVLIKVIVGVDMEIAIIFGILICGILYIARGIMKPGAFFDSIVKGMESMVSLILLMIFAYMLVEANSQLGLTDFIIAMVLPLMNDALFPLIVFLVAGGLGFFTGSFWGVAAILMPIIIPMAQELDVSVYLAAGSVISGIVFASHACFFGDSLLLASFATEVKPMKIAMVVLPYALIGAIITAVLYLIIGII